MPKLSVILTCYNSKKEYLDECIESILNQTFKDFELLVIDDCSTVLINKLVKKYIEKDNRVKYIKTSQNVGAAGARNLGLTKAFGEYIAIMDHDDIAVLNRFEKQIAFLDANPDVGVLGGAFKRFPNEKEFYPLQGNKEITLSMLLNQNEFCQSSVMIRKSVLDQFNILYRKDEIPCEDYGFFLNLVGKTKFANLSDILIYYRVHDSNISKVNVDKMIYLSAKLRVQNLSRLFEITQDDFKKALLQLDLKSVDKNNLLILEQQMPCLFIKMKEYGYDYNQILYYYRKKYLYLLRKAKKPFDVFLLCQSSLTDLFRIPILKKYSLLIKYTVKSFFN